MRRLTALVPTVVLAWRNLSRARARSALAVVAIVIGVVAIGAIGSGGETFKEDQLRAYEGFGGTATVDPVFYPDDHGPTDRTFSRSDIERMRQAATGATVTPIVEPARPGQSFVRTASGDTIVTAQIRGLESPGAFYRAQSGSIPANWRRTAIVGSRIASDHDVQPGDRITIAIAGSFDRSFVVAAVLEPQGFADPLQADQAVFLPIDQFDGTEYDSAIVQVDPQTGSVEDAATAIEREFNTRRRTVRVQSVQEQRAQFEQFFGTINTFLVGVGAISLLVAAVTIANTMLMSVIEREGEIGLLRAVGFQKGAVIRLLVTESTILGVVGAALGAPLALGVGALINQLLLGNPLAFSASGLRYVGIGVAFGVVTALAAGVYPAWRAAARRPAEVLH